MQYWTEFLEEWGR